MRKATRADIPSIVDIHQQVLPHTLSSLTGKSYLRVLYLSLVDDASSSVFVAESEGQIIGIVSLTKDLHQTSKTIKKHFFTLLWFIVYAWVKKTITLGEIIQSFTFERELSHMFPQEYPTILTLGVIASERSKGVGTALINQVKDTMIRHAICTFYVDTQLNNTRAQKFYMRHGGIHLTTINNNTIYKFSV